MKVKVIGPRILVRVKKFKVEDVERIEGSMLVRALADSEVAEKETIHQTVGQVYQLGNSIESVKEVSDLKVGDKVHFSRYGAIQLKSLSNEDHELWLMMAKDVLLVEYTEGA